jgi:hypothetical protein
MRQKGQALVEAALVIPLMMFILLGVFGVFYLDLQHRSMQNSIDVLADVAALRHDDSWHSLVGEEDVRSGCHADPQQPDVEYPDGNAEAGSRILLRWHCTLRTNWVFDGSKITVEAERVIGPTPTTAPSPAPTTTGRTK